MFRISSLILIASTALAQPQPLRVGNGVTTPKLISKIEPVYTDEARRNGISGVVLIELVVNTKGEPTEIALISPLGYGLDENAEYAIRQWRFTPATKENKPVPVLAVVEVSFSHDGGDIDKSEKHRAALNRALAQIRRGDEKGLKYGSESLIQLANKKYPPAMARLGVYYLTGGPVSKDIPAGLELLEAAALKNEKFALAELGSRTMRGDGLEKDDAKGLELLKQASVLGSTAAQFELGKRFADGDGVGKDAERARRYFRLCAASGTGPCQYMLGKMLLAQPNSGDRVLIQAVAWLDLAASANVNQARLAAAEAKAHMTQEQLQWVERLKHQLIRPR